MRFKPESLDNLVKLTKFNKRELKLMYRGFKQLCPAGVVKEDKFKLIYAQFFPRGAETNGYARFVFNSFDVQRKQEITFTDFVIGLSVLTRGSIDDQLRWIFTLYDINADGVITRDELAKIVASVHDLMGHFAMNAVGQQSGGQAGQQSAGARSRTASPSAPPDSSDAAGEQRQQQQEPASAESAPSSEEQAESLFRKFDLNNDGVITLDEFIEACHKVSRRRYLTCLAANPRLEFTH